ncbi:MAG: hypothetical protein Q8R12_00005 [bacterium]|nr:hypothetical protein [bacterium]
MDERSAPPPAAEYGGLPRRKTFFTIFDLRAPPFFLLKGKESFSARLRAQSRGVAGLRFRLGRGGRGVWGEFRRALALFDCAKSDIKLFPAWAKCREKLFRYCNSGVLYTTLRIFPPTIVLHIENHILRIDKVSYYSREVFLPYISIHTATRFYRCLS